MTVQGTGAVCRQVGAIYRGGAVAGLGDEELLARFASRRDEEAAEAAFAAIVARHGPMVLGVCRRLVRDEADAEDAFQATFLVLSRRAGEVRVGDSAGRWLHGVARKVAGRARRRAAGRRDATGAIAPEVASADPGPADLAIARERADLLRDEVDRLPDRYREAVVLCHLEGRSLDEAAARLGRPVGTIKARLSRARSLLRDRLSRRGLAPELLPIVPAPLAHRTIRLALRDAFGPPAGGAIAGLSASAAVLRLAGGVAAVSGWTKAPTVGVALLSMGVTVAVVGGLALRDGQGPPHELAEGDARHATIERSSLAWRGPSPRPSPRVRGEGGGVSTLAPVRGGEGGRSPGEGASARMGRDDHERLRDYRAELQLKIDEVTAQLGEREAGLEVARRALQVEELGFNFARARLDQLNAHAREVDDAIARLDQDRRAGGNDPGPAPSAEEPTPRPLPEPDRAGRGGAAAPEAGTGGGVGRDRGPDPRDNPSDLGEPVPALPPHRSPFAVEPAGQPSPSASPGGIRPVRPDGRAPGPFDVEDEPVPPGEVVGGPGPAPDWDPEAVAPPEVDPGLPPEYVVEPPDLIRIEVLEALPGRPIAGERLVRPDGRVSLDFYGEISVAGLTPMEIKERVILHLREFLTDESLGLVEVDPDTMAYVMVHPRESDRVFVDVVAYNSKPYYVQGDVALPGRFNATGGDTVLDAITYAGGLLPTADPKRLRLIRPAPAGSGDEAEELPVDLEAIVERGDPATNYELKPGDRLVVPRSLRVLAEQRFREDPEVARIRDEILAVDEEILKFRRADLAAEESDQEELRRRAEASLYLEDRRARLENQYEILWNSIVDRLAMQQPGDADSARGEVGVPPPVEEALGASVAVVESATAAELARFEESLRTLAEKLDGGAARERPGMFTVSGEVRTPGEFVVAGGLRVSDALRLTGGINLAGDDLLVYLLRPGEPMRSIAIGQDGRPRDEADDAVIRVGDQLVVPRPGGRAATP